MTDESQPDDLEEHRKRIRRIIEENRDVLDALAGIDTEDESDE